MDGQRGAAREGSEIERGSTHPSTHPRGGQGQEGRRGVAAGRGRREREVGIGVGGMGGLVEERWEIGKHEWKRFHAWVH